MWLASHRLGTEEIANWIYWPDKNVVQKTMPQAFCYNYSQGRAIIDCFELKINETINNRTEGVLLFSV